MPFLFDELKYFAKVQKNKYGLLFFLIFFQKIMQSLLGGDFYGGFLSGVLCFVVPLQRDKQKWGCKLLYLYPFVFSYFTELQI